MDKCFEAMDEVERQY